MDPDITEDLVRQLVEEQFPQWASLPVAAVRQQGSDNRTYRLGTDLALRLPSADGYSDGLIREGRTLALLGPQVTFGLPVAVAAGQPSPTFPRAWSVRRWIAGVTLLDLDRQARQRALTEVASALSELHAANTDCGPWAGWVSAYRGCHLSVYAADVQQTLPAHSAKFPELEHLWDRAMTSVWPHPGRWLHGDVAPGNMLFDHNGGLVALIDLGQTCVGDPACDLAFAWLFCTHTERTAFREIVRPDDETWLRGAAWALWKALISDEAYFTRTGARPREEILADLNHSTLT